MNQRPVDANSIIKKLCAIATRDDIYGVGLQDGIAKAKQIIEHTSTIDAVPVVRCKECKYWSEIDFDGHYGNGIVCRLCIRETAWRPLFRDAKDFCSYGERMDEEAEHE